MILTVYDRTTEPPTELGTITTEDDRVVVTETGGPPSLRAMVDSIVVIRRTPADGEAYLRGLAQEIGHSGYYEVGVEP